MPKGDNQVFTLDMAVECLELLKAGATTKSLCEKYKCTKQTIADIKYNRTWKGISR